MNVHLHFNEPIMITNVSAFLLSNSLSVNDHGEPLDGAQGVKSFRINATVNYSNLQMEAIFTIQDICTQYGWSLEHDMLVNHALSNNNSFPMICLARQSFAEFLDSIGVNSSHLSVNAPLTASAELYLSFDGSAAVDFAKIPNGVVPVTSKFGRREGNPGIT
jgi:hypothetical protein